MVSQVLGGLIAVVAVAIIAYFSQGLKRFFIALVLSFFISIAVYDLILSFLQVRLDTATIPVLMIIATIIELWRENKNMQKTNTPEKQMPP